MWRGRVCRFTGSPTDGSKLDQPASDARARRDDLGDAGSNTPQEPNDRSRRERDIIDCVQRQAEAEDFRSERWTDVAHGAVWSRSMRLGYARAVMANTSTTLSACERDQPTHSTNENPPTTFDIVIVMFLRRADDRLAARRKSLDHLCIVLSVESRRVMLGSRLECRNGGRLATDELATRIRTRAHRSQVRVWPRVSSRSLDAERSGCGCRRSQQQRRKGPPSPQHQPSWGPVPWSGARQTPMHSFGPDFGGKDFSQRSAARGSGTRVIFERWSNTFACSRLHASPGGASSGGVAARNARVRPRRLRFRPKTGRVVGIDGRKGVRRPKDRPICWPAGSVWEHEILFRHIEERRLHRWSSTPEFCGAEPSQIFGPPSGAVIPTPRSISSAGGGPLTSSEPATRGPETPSTIGRAKLRSAAGPPRR